MISTTAVTKKRRSPRSSSNKGPPIKKAASRFSSGSLKIDGTLAQTLMLLEREQGNLLNTLLILEQLVVEWKMTIEEIQDHVCGLMLEEVNCFVADEAHEEWGEEEEGENDTSQISPQADNSVSCFLQGALELDASFKNAGRPEGLEDAKQLIESLSTLTEHACAGVSTGSHTPQQRAAAYAVGRGTPGRWTMSCQ